MAEDTNIAYRLRKNGLESAPVIDGKIASESWVLVDFDSLPSEKAQYLQSMKECMIYASKVE